MKKTHLNFLIIILLAGMLVGFGSYALAGSEPGYGPCRRFADRQDLDANDFDRGRWRNARQGDCWNNLSDEEQKKLAEERTAFRDATKDLRREIQRKKLEIQAELVGKTTDAKKALGLQKELSELKAQLDLKRLDHWLRIKEIIPDADPPSFAFFHKGRGYRWQGFHGGCR